LWLQKNVWQKIFFHPFLFYLFLDPRSGIRDPGWVKIRIRDKHPGSATLFHRRFDVALFSCFGKTVSRIFFPTKTDPVFSVDLHVGGGDGQNPGAAKDGERSSSCGAECRARHYKGQTHPHRELFLAIQVFVSLENFCVVRFDPFAHQQIHKCKSCTSSVAFPTYLDAYKKLCGY
jgi:hypothetical protein